MTIANCTLLAEVDMISAGVVGLIALLVLVFAILSAKDWHWVNVVLLVLTLIASITSIIGMTFAYQHRREGMLLFNKESQRALKQEARVVEIVSGDPLSLKYDKGSLRDSNNRLALAMTARGNAWRGCTVTADGEQNKFTLKNERKLEDETSLLGAIVYAFSENDGIPANYIGSVAVEVKEAEYILEPVDLIDTQRFKNPQAKWTLFEKMPQDRHGIFKKALSSKINSAEAGDKDSPAAKLVKALEESKEIDKHFVEIDIAEFTKILKRDFLPANQLGYAPDSLEYEQLIDQYAFDGQPIGNIKEYIENTPGRISTEFDPAPEKTFVKFSFTAASDSAVRTDAEENVGSLENDGLYNTNGESIVGVLQQNPNGVTFKTNDVVLIDHENTRIRAAQFVQETATAQATTAQTQIALEDANKQIEVRTDLIDKRTQDGERFKRDTENLTKTNEAMRGQSAKLKQQIENLKVKTDWQYKQIQTQTVERLRNAVSVSQ